MAQIGRKIYYDNRTGEILVDTGEKSGDVRDTTQEEDFTAYPALSDRSEDTIDVIELNYGDYSDDFAHGQLARIDLESKQLYFTYPNPTEPGGQTPEQPSLSEQIKSLQDENTLLKAQNTALSERSDFIEDVIAEMAMQVYQ